MNILLWVIFGGLAGWIASVIVGNDAGTGMVWNIIIGIVGAFLGGWMADRLGVGGAPGADRPTSAMSFVTAVVGAIVFLFVLNLII